MNATTAAASWPKARADQLMAKLGKWRNHGIRYGFHVDPAAERLSYFPPDLDDELAQWTPEPFEYVRLDANAAPPEIVIWHSAGHLDEPRKLWELREVVGNDALIAVWMWDNHIGVAYNLRAALAADLVFFSHSEDCGYLFNPLSVIAGHIPACSAQWRRNEAEHLFLRHGGAPRRHSLLMNYVEYGFTPVRNAVLSAVREHVREATMLTMPADDRRRYFHKSAEQRFVEWAQHKATLILPVTTDLSTRVFDALLCGLVPIVPVCIPDFDVLVPEEAQERMGIVRLESWDIDEIRDATRRALANFDDMGDQGMMERHRFVLENHLLINRVTSTLHVLYHLIDGMLDITFGDGEHGPALYLERAQQ